RLTLPVCPPGDPMIGQASIAFGKPNPADLLASPGLRWVHLSSAGYEQYDRDDLRVALRGRGVPLSNSSTVYAEPCAEHVLAMMTSLSRRLPQALDNQRREHAWGYIQVREHMR